MRPSAPLMITSGMRNQSGQGHVRKPLNNLVCDSVKEPLVFKEHRGHS